MGALREILLSSLSVESKEEAIVLLYNPKKKGDEK